MKKWGFLSVFICFIFIVNVNASSLNKTISNPYDIASYTITDRSNNTAYEAGSADDDIMRSLAFNTTKQFNFRADISFLSNSNPGSLDIGDGALFYNDDVDLLYWIVPMCVNKYDFYVSMNSGTCPACMEKDTDVTILYGDSNTCSFVDPDFVGPVQYLSDPSKGTIAYLIFKVKEYRVPSTFLTATANDTFTIYNNQSDYPLVYRFLNINSNIGGLFDALGKANFRLSHYSRDYAIVQNDNVNSPYKCIKSYNNLDISQGSYFSNDTLTMSTNTLPLVRNLDETNLLPNYVKNSCTSRGITFTYNSDGSYSLSGRNDGTGNSACFIVNNSTNSFTLNSGTYYTYLNNSVNGFVLTGYNGTNYFNLGSYANNRFTINNNTTFTQIYLQILNGTTQTFNGEKIYPTIYSRNLNVYVPYNVYGFNVDISSSQSSVFTFLDTNLKENGKIRTVTKYLDSYNGDITYISSDLIVGRESSFHGLTSHMYYDSRFEPYNTCLYGFGFLCGQKYPQVVQFQLIDTSNIYTFTKPMLYYYEADYNTWTGYTEYDTSSDELYKSIPNYVPPGDTVCYDSHNGIMYNYSSKSVIYDSNSGSSDYERRVYADNELSAIFGNYELPDNFGLSGLIDIPVTFINDVRHGTCSPININFNIKGRNVNAVSLPCGQSFWNRQDLAPFRPFISTFLTGFFAYNIIFSLYFFIRHNRDPIKISNSDGQEGIMYL